MMPETYDIWLDRVRDTLRSINMRIEDWQGVWPFDFGTEYKAGTNPGEAAAKANRYWWREQNKSLNQNCERVLSCWLPKGHPGKCEATYEAGDYVKVEFPDEVTGIGEWMWMRVDQRDDAQQLVFGTLDNEPLNYYKGKVKLGSRLAISYTEVREHRNPTQFKSKN